MPKAQPTAPLPGFLAMTLSEDAAPLRARVTVTKSADFAAANLATLTRAMRAGDAAAFARFYDIYRFRVYKHLLVLAKGDEAVAREVFQTVAIKLAKKIAVFDDERPLLAWLQRVARNAFIDDCRVRRRDARLVPIDDVEAALSAGDGMGAPLREGLRRALAECAPEDRECLNAIYVDGKSLGVVAAQSGQSYKALESRLARLRQKVRKSLLAHLRHE